MRELNSENKSSCHRKNMNKSSEILNEISEFVSVALSLQLLLSVSGQFSLFQHKLNDTEIKTWAELNSKIQSNDAERIVWVASIFNNNMYDNNN